jgi:hypothetical protein
MQAQEGVSTDSGASQAEGLPIRERFSIAPGDAGVPHGVRALGEVLRGRECAEAVGLQASGAADSEEWVRSMRAAVRREGERGAREEGREPVRVWGGGGCLAAEKGPLGTALSRALESEDAERECARAAFYEDLGEPDPRPAGGWRNRPTMGSAGLDNW